MTGQFISVLLGKLVLILSSMWIVSALLPLYCSVSRSNYRLTRTRSTKIFVQTSVSDSITEHQKIFIGALSDNLRGVKAVERIDGTKPLVTVPSTMVLQVTNNRPPSPFPDFINQELWEKSLWFQRLAYKLLFECDIQAVEEKKSWFQQLPKSFTTPFHWDTNAIKELQYPALQTKVAFQKDEWRKDYDMMIAQSKLGKSITFQRYVWALENVNSRAFSGVYEGSDAQDRSKLLIFTGVLTILWPLLQLGTWDQSLSGALVVGSSILARDFVLSKAGTFKRYVLCPTIDMFNHQSSCTSDVGYNYFSDSFELKTQAYAENEQIFINYGKQSNDRFLQYYGFVETDNPYDTYDFGENILTILVKQGDLLQEQGASFPSTGPSPVERLKTLARFLQDTQVDEASYTGDKSTQKTLSSSKLTSAASLTMRCFRTKVPSSTETQQQSSSLLPYVDEITKRSLRLMYCSENEYQTKVNGKLNLDALADEVAETEAKIAKALRILLEYELSSKPTALADDISLLQAVRSPSSSASKKGFSSTAENSNSKHDKQTRGSAAGEAADPSGVFADHKYAAIAFRIEKKKLLQELLSKM